MNFRTLHLWMRGSILVLVPALALGILLPESSLQRALTTGAVVGFLAQGTTGAILAVLLLWNKMRLYCPACKRKETRLLWFQNKKTPALMCEHCGIFRECGPFKLKLKLEPYTDEHGNPL
jgi:hypothetical protein